MLGTLISGAARVRLALWAVEMAIPESAGLRLRFRSVLCGVVAAVAGGVLASSIAVAALVGTGYFLVHNGTLSVLESVALLGIACVVGIYVLFDYGSRKFSEAFVRIEEAPRANKNTTEEMMQDLINGFVEGLLVGKETPPSQPEETRKEPCFTQNKAA